MDASLRFVVKVKGLEEEEEEEEEEFEFEFDLLSKISDYTYVQRHGHDIMVTFFNK